MAYSKVERRTWNDERFRHWTRDTREMWFYLMTCPHMEQIGGRLGCFVLDSMYAAADLSSVDERWTPERVERELARLQAEDRIAWDPDARLVLLKNFFVHNPPANPNVAKAAAADVAALPFSETLSKGLLDAVEKILPKRFESRKGEGEPCGKIIADAIRSRLRNTLTCNNNTPSETVPVTLPEGLCKPLAIHEHEQEHLISGPNGPSPDSTGSKSGDAVIDALWGVWLDELGGAQPHPKLTTGKRRSVLRLLYSEYLRPSGTPLDTFRRICEAVKRSDHHMSKREYHLPESLFRNQERRERWYLEATNPSTPQPAGSGRVDPRSVPEDERRSKLEKKLQHVLQRDPDFPGGLPDDGRHGTFVQPIDVKLWDAVCREAGLATRADLEEPHRGEVAA